MRLAPLASCLAAATLLVASARADLGPRPQCEKGKHHEYLMGHKCVPDGSHVERDPAGGVRFVPNDKKPDAPTHPTSVPTPVLPTSTATASAEAPPPAPPPPTPSASAEAPPPAPAPSASSAPAAPRSGCSFSEVETGGAATMVAMIGALFVLRRKRR